MLEWERVSKPHKMECQMEKFEPKVNYLFYKTLDSSEAEVRCVLFHVCVKEEF
jgi:hypothetical protein